MSNICIIGKHLLKEDLLTNELDAPVILHFAKHFSKVFLIYQTYRKTIIRSSHKNIHSYLIPKKSRYVDTLYFIVNAVFLARRIHRAHRLDLISASEPFGGGISGLFMKLLFKIKILLQLQGEVFNYPPETHSWLKRKMSFAISKIVSHFSDRIRCVSKAVYRQALEAGISAAKLAYSPARCNTGIFDPETTKEERVNIRRTLGFSRNDVLITVSSLVPDKGMREFIQAFIDLQQDHPELRAMIVGDGPLKGELQKWVASTNLDEKVAFCGFVAHSKMPGYLSAGDVFVLPTKHEGMGRAILEAMAMELPVLASAVGGILEIISDGVTGILLENGTPEEIADNVALLLRDKKYRRELGRKARQYVIENHDFETAAEHLVQMHYELSAI